MANEINEIDEKDAVSWAPEVIADSSGRWSRNSLRFATREEAAESALALSWKWMAVREHRAAPAAEPVNSRWDAETRSAVTVETPDPTVAPVTRTVTEVFLDGLQPPLKRRGEGSSSVKEVVARIRLETKAAITSGVIPAGTKLSITSDHNSVNVKITAWPGQVLNDAYTSYLMDGYAAKREAERTGIPVVEKAFDWRTSDGGDRQYPYFTAQVAEAITLLHKLADRHNYNNSDIMTDYFDVGYYLNVSCHGLQAMAERGLQLEWDPAFAEKARQAAEAATRLGPKVTASVCGDLDHASVYEMDRLLKLDEQAKGRPVTYDKRRRRWVVQDSRRDKLMQSYLRAGLPNAERAAELADLDNKVVKAAIEEQDEGEWEAKAS